jgi:hypothetical protein
MTQWFCSFVLEKILTKKLAKLIKLILEKQKIPKIPQFICQKIAQKIQEKNTGMTLLVYSSVGWFLLLLRRTFGSGCTH